MLIETISLSIPYDAPKEKVETLIRRELQTENILSVEVEEEIVTVHLAASKKSKSKVLYSECIGSVPVTVVSHHSSLLPVWLQLLRETKDISIVHIDRHSDLDMPNLIKVSDTVYDRWTKLPVHWQLMDSVSNAVDSSAIEIGNFLTVALYLLNIKSLLWLHPADVIPIFRETALSVGWTGIDPLFSEIRRLAISPIYENSKEIKFFSYSSFEETARLLSETDSNNVLLDIDLDYFDSSNEELDRTKILPKCNTKKFKCPVTIHRMIDTLFDTIGLKRLKAIGIAASPGFCPTNIAAVLINIILKKLNRYQKDKNEI